MSNDRIKTDHDKNLDFFADNYPDLLDDYIDFYENGVTISDEVIIPEDMLQVVELVASFKKDLAFKLN